MKKKQEKLIVIKKKSLPFGISKKLRSMKIKCINKGSQNK